MPASERLRVFISYARKDGASLAQRLQTDLTKEGFDVWLDTQRIQGGASWTKEIEKALDGAEWVLALVTSGSYVSEICRAEQLRALRKGKCIMETGRELRTLEGHSDSVEGVAVSADGRRAVSASEDNTLRVWDLETGALIVMFTCDAAVRSCVIIGQDKVIAGDARGRVHFLSLEDTKQKD